MPAAGATTAYFRRLMLPPRQSPSLGRRFFAIARISRLLMAPHARFLHRYSPQARQRYFHLLAFARAYCRLFCRLGHFYFSYLSARAPAPPARSTIYIITYSHGLSAAELHERRMLIQVEVDTPI